MTDLTREILETLVLLLNLGLSLTARRAVSRVANNTKEHRQLIDQLFEQKG